MTKSYHKGGSVAALLPAIELMERSREIVHDAMLEIGRLTLETVLSLSAVEVAGEPARGKRKGEVRHHGSQPGHVKLGGKRIQVDRPRLRDRAGHEVAVPAYGVLKTDPKAGERALNRVLRGVSTREYKGIFDEAGQEIGLSKTTVSRMSSKAAEAKLEALTSRRIETRQLAVMLDGVHIGDCVCVAAVGIDEKGAKRVLGLTEGATENSASVGALLDSLIERGLDPEAPILFVVDGSKALRKAVRDRFPHAVVQRCRLHKIRNVLDHLPLAKRKYVNAKLNLAYRLPYDEALAKLEEIAKELEVLHPGAASSLREGLIETLTVSRLNLSPLLASSLGSTNLIEGSFSRARAKLGKITNYSSGKMAMRWCASALALAEQGFRTLKGVKDLWMLKAVLDTHLEVKTK